MWGCKGKQVIGHKALLCLHLFTLVHSNPYEPILVPPAFVPFCPCALLHVCPPILAPYHHCALLPCILSPLCPLALYLPDLVPLHPPALALSYLWTVSPLCPQPYALAHLYPCPSALVPSCPWKLLPLHSHHFALHTCALLPLNPPALVHSCPCVISPSNPGMFLPVSS